MARLISSFYSLIPVVVVLVGCGREQDTEPTPPPILLDPMVEEAPPPVEPDTPSSGSVSLADASTEATTPKSNVIRTIIVRRTPKAHPPPTLPRLYDGSASLEERIAAADVIATARLHSVAASVERYESKARSGGTSEEEEFVGTLQFTFNVSRYLKGDGTLPTQLKAVVRSLVFSGTREEAQANADRMLAERDTQWDNREAVIFLIEESDDVPVTRSDNVFYMSIWDINGGRTGDQYSIASQRNKIWLPEASQSSDGRAGPHTEKWFLTDVPTGTTAQSGQGRSSTQTSLKTPSVPERWLVQEIRQMNAELTAQPEYKYEVCVAFGYYWERQEKRYRAQDKVMMQVPVYEKEIVSGLPAGTNVGIWQRLFVVNQDWKTKIWFEGDDADLFDVSETADGTWPDEFSIYNSFNAVGGKFLIEFTDNSTRL